MKRFLPLLLVVFILLSMIGCSKENAQSDSDKDVQSSVVEDSSPDNVDNTNIDSTGAETTVNTGASNINPTGGSTNGTSGKPNNSDNTNKTNSNNTSTAGTTKTEKPAFGSYQERLAAFRDPNGRMMVCAHRGYFTDKIPENSTASILNAIKYGADMVEIDVARTKDGHFILMHDSTLTRTTDAAAKRPAGVSSYEVSDWTLDQIKTLNLKEGKGGYDAGITEYKVCTLKEALELCKGKVLVNLDKSWSYRNELYTFIAENGYLENVMVKGTALASSVNIFLDPLEKKYGVRPIFVPIVSGSTTSVLNTYKSFQNTGKVPIMFEVAFTGASFINNYDKNILNTLKGNVRLFVNTLNDFGTDVDNLTEWKKLDEAGYNVIQTDKTAELAQYVKQKYGY